MSEYMLIMDAYPGFVFINWFSRTCILFWNCLTSCSGTMRKYTLVLLSTCCPLVSKRTTLKVHVYYLLFCQKRKQKFISSVQSLSRGRLFATPWTAALQASLSVTNSRSLLKASLFNSIKSVMPSNHLILCHPLLLLPSIFPSIRVFSNESVLPIRWPKYWSFNFNISPSNEYSRLISFRINWFDLLAVQGTLKSLLQHHS